MKIGRLEAFSDGVIAIIITIMVLEMKVPHGDSLTSLRPLLPVFFSYVLSFVYVGIYWNNHHHMLHTCARISGAVLWANLHLLFWLSLFPFTTGWMGENKFAAIPSALYGVVLLMAALAYWILQQTIIAVEGPDSLLKRAVGSDWKGKLSPILYLLAIVHLFFAGSGHGRVRGGRAPLAGAGSPHRADAAGHGALIKAWAPHAADADFSLRDLPVFGYSGAVAAARRGLPIAQVAIGTPPRPGWPWPETADTAQSLQEKQCIVS